jgi:hypothetical protein
MEVQRPGGVASAEISNPNVANPNLNPKGSADTAVTTLNTKNSGIAKN